MDLKLTGKNALVLASSSGLGKAVAKELAAEGANVMLTSRNKDKLEAAKADIETVAKGSVDYVVADLTNPDDITNLVTQTRERYGKLNILINNSGGPKAGRFEDLTESDWQTAFDLTLFSYIRVIQAVLPDLKETKGRILNNTSISIKQPIDGLLLSNAFRMGIQGLSKTLARDLASEGILVNTIGAGRINTDRINDLDGKRADEKDITIDQLQAQMAADIPMGRYGEPEEFGKMAAFLVSYANTYVTGQTILVDGGMIGAY